MTKRFLPATNSRPKGVKIDLEGVPQIPYKYRVIMDRKIKNKLTRRQERECDAVIAAAKAEIFRRVLRALEKQGKTKKYLAE